MFFAQRWLRRGIRGCPRCNASGGIGVGRENEELRKSRGKDSRDRVSLNRWGRKKKEFNTGDTATTESTEKRRTGEGSADAKKRQRAGDLRLPSGQVEDAEIHGETEAGCAGGEEIGADDAGHGAAEPAGGAADARIPCEPGAGKTRNPGLGGNLAAAGVLLARKTCASGADSLLRNRRAGGRTTAQHVRNNGEGTRRAGERAGTRRVDHAKRATSFSDLDGAFLAGTAGSLREETRAATRILGNGNRARERSTRQHPEGSRTFAPRSGVDGELDDRAVCNGTELAEARAAADEIARAGKKSGICWREREKVTSSRRARTEAGGGHGDSRRGEHRVE